MSNIQQNIEHISSLIHSAQQKCGRAPDSVQLLAVSKTKPLEDVIQAAKAGQVAFGENYVQEGVDKVQQIQQIAPEFNLDWHFIGPIQSNKTKPVAENFDWVHTVDRSKIAQRLNDQRPADKEPLQVLIQVNTSGESSKSGATEAEVFELAELISSLPNLTLRGLMSIPANVTDYQSQLEAFQQLAQMKEKLSEKIRSYRYSVDGHDWRYGSRH